MTTTTMSLFGQFTSLVLTTFNIHNVQLNLTIVSFVMMSRMASTYVGLLFRLARSVYNDRVARWATLDAQIAESFAGVDVRAFHRDAQLFGECDWTHVPLIGGEEAMEAQQAV